MDNVKASPQIGVLNYSLPDQPRARMYATDTSQNKLFLNPVETPIYDRRFDRHPPTLEDAGFELIPHVSQIRDWTDEKVAEAYTAEISAFLYDLTGADKMVMTYLPTFRFGEPLSDRVIHSDVSDKTAKIFADRHCPYGKAMKRFVHFKVWRVISEPPQDIPLTLCDGRTINRDDLIITDMIYDKDGQELNRFEGYVISHNPNHKWSYYSDMTADEVIVSKTYDSNGDGVSSAFCVPHSEFDNHNVSENTPPRQLVEILATAFWFDKTTPTGDKRFSK